ncbi:hypothetical protein Q5530_01940 [Saccharothrix sp. BKS2]|uniref:hypothetical protein n=1 Tax=Saccharothrix sp. BKS2 TaxID=3064400 RepID=UPI0039ED7000
MSERETKSVHVREVPAEVIDALQARATALDVPLNTYLRDILVDRANRPTMQEWVAETSTQYTWSLDHETIQQAVREVRESEG